MRKIVLATLACVATMGMAQGALAQQGEAAAGEAKPAANGEPMKIFVNELGSGWQNRSWAQVELGIDTGVARKPIRVEAGPWQALYLHHEPFSTAPFRKLKLLIQSSPPGGQPVRVILLSGGKPLSETGKLVALKPGGWTQVEIPLATLNAENATVDGLWVQNGTDQQLTPFYVSDIVLN